MKNKSKVTSAKDLIHISAKNTPTNMLINQKWILIRFLPQKPNIHDRILDNDFLNF